MKRIILALFMMLLFTPSANAETWKIDPDHSAAHFAIEHMMIAKVRGDFHGIKGKIDFKGGIPVKLNVTIDVNSIDTGVDKRDAHLKSADFLEAESYPEMSFISKKIIPVAGGFRALGTLTIKGVSHDAEFSVAGLKDIRKDPWGNDRKGGKAELTIDRREFNIDWNAPIDGGGFMIGNDVEIIVDLEALKDK